MTPTVLWIVALAAVWLLAALRFSRYAVWLMLLWVPIQGWFQLNLFNDSSATVLLYEYQIVGIYLVFAFHAARAPESFGPPRLLWFAVPFTVWAMLLTPRSVELHGPLLAAMGLRTYLLTFPLLWIGYRTFTTRRQVENLGYLLMLQAVVIAGVAATQYLGATTANTPSSFFDVPVGYIIVGTVRRPPGTFSAPGQLGMYVLFAILFGFGLLGFRAALWKRLGFLIGLAGSVVALMINTQRAAMVLLAVTLPLMVALARGRRSAMAVGTALAVIAVGGFLGAQVAGDAFVSRFTSITDDAGSTLNIIPTEKFIDAMQTPFIGRGIGIAVPGAGRFLAPNFSRIVNANLSVIYGEQFMAGLVYQTGVPGLLMFYLFIVAILYRSLQAVRVCRGTSTALFAASIFSFQVAILLDSWSYDPLDTIPTRVLFWFWSGVLLSLPRLAATAAVQERAAIPLMVPVQTRRLARSPRPAARRPSVA